MAFRGRTRAVVTAVVALLGYYGAVAALALPLFFVMPAEWVAEPVGLAAAGLPLIVGAGVANLFVVRRGWSSWPTLGWPGMAAGARGIGAGMALGVVLAAVTLATIVGSGGARVLVTQGSPGGYAARAAGVAGLLLVAALSEELLFRGYPLARLSRAVGRVGASVALAIVFATVHLANPGVTVVGLVNIGLASLVLSAAFFTRGGLPAAWGLHFGWNAGLGLGADAPISGIGFELPLLEYAAGRPEWVSGGSFGPEGGVAATLALALGLGVLVRGVRRLNGRGAT